MSKLAIASGKVQHTLNLSEIAPFLIAKISENSK
jgi:hypothetical protein